MQRTRKHPLHLLRAYLARHAHAALSSLRQLSRTPLSTLMTCIVIGIALALPMALYIILKNADAVGKQFQQSAQITLYLTPDTGEARAQEIVNLVRHHPDVRAARTISPMQGLQELQQETGVDNLLVDLPANPLPWAIIASPMPRVHTADALNDLSHSLKQLPQVDSVQIDTLWIERLFAMINLAHRAVFALSFFLAVGVLLIVNNCIRTATQQSKREIDIIRLIGATHHFVRRPFLYAGMMYGLLGGIIAWQLVDLLLIWLKLPTHQLAMLYRSDFELLGIGLQDTALLLTLSIGLGLMGAWVAVTRHLYTPATH